MYQLDKTLSPFAYRIVCLSCCFVLLIIDLSCLSPSTTNPIHIYHTHTGRETPALSYCIYKFMCPPFHHPMVTEMAYPTQAESIERFENVLSVLFVLNENESLNVMGVKFLYIFYLEWKSLAVEVNGRKRMDLVAQVVLLCDQGVDRALCR